MDTLGLSFSTHQLLVHARSVAHSMRHNYVSTDHLLIALSRLDDRPSVIRLMENLGAQINRVAEVVSSKMSPGETSHVFDVDVIEQSPHLHKVIEIAYHEANDVGALSVAPEHIVIGILKAPDGIARRVLNQEFGITLESFMKQYESPVEIPS